MRILFRNARLVFSPGQGVLPGALLVEDGVIQSFDPSGDEVRITGVDRSIDCRGDFLAPGLIDLHCHGAVGRDAMEALTGAFDQILRFHATNGTTTVVLSTVAASLPEMIAVLEGAEQYRDALTGIRLPQDTDFLFCRVLLAFHVFGLVGPEN